MRSAKKQKCETFVELYIREFLMLFLWMTKKFFLNFSSKLFLTLLLLFLLMNRATIDDLVFLGDFKMKTTLFVIRFLKIGLAESFVQVSITNVFQVFV